MFLISRLNLDEIAGVLFPDQPSPKCSFIYSLYRTRRALLHECFSTILPTSGSDITLPGIIFVKQHNLRSSGELEPAIFFCASGVLPTASYRYSKYDAIALTRRRSLNCSVWVQLYAP